MEDEISKPKQLDCGVPQGSCLGPVLFLLYASGLFQVVNKHLPTAHAYADDSQIYLSFRPHSSASQDLAVSAIESCVADVRAWLVSHRLMFNDTKTELLIIGSKNQLSKVSIDSIKVGDSQIKPSEAVRNLGSWFDSHMNMTLQVGKICSKAFHGLYNIRHIRKFLSPESTKILVHAFVTCHLDYCNSLLHGISQCQINRLQKVLNSAARIITLTPKFQHITPVLLQLHWLPINFRIQFKIALFVYKSLDGTAPAYLKDLLQPQSQPKYHLRSRYQRLLAVPRSFRKTFGDRSFEHAAPKLWNTIPHKIRESANIDISKRKLKTHFLVIFYVVFCFIFSLLFQSE